MQNCIAEVEIDDEYIEDSMDEAAELRGVYPAEVITALAPWCPRIREFLDDL